jgi:hypothetical protein
MRVMTYGCLLYSGTGPALTVEQQAASSHIREMTVIFKML